MTTTTSNAHDDQIREATEAFNNLGQAARILFASLTGGPELRMTLLGVDYGEPSECVLGLYS